MTFYLAALLGILLCCLGGVTSLSALIFGIGMWFTASGSFVQFVSPVTCGGFFILLYSLAQYVCFL